MIGERRDGSDGRAFRPCKDNAEDCQALSKMLLYMIEESQRLGRDEAAHHLYEAMRALLEEKEPPHLTLVR